jgi:hypothetical protein
VPVNDEYAILKEFAVLEKTPNVPALDLPGLDIVATAKAYGGIGVAANTVDENKKAFAEAFQVSNSDRDPHCSPGAALGRTRSRLARFPPPGPHKRSAAGPVTSKKDKKVKIERSTAKFTSVVALILLASSSNPRANAQSLTTNGESGVFLQPLEKMFRHLKTSSVGLSAFNSKQFKLHQFASRPP